jgi:acetyl-CoA carboxylase carboxyl transferase subunit alpha
VIAEPTGGAHHDHQASADAFRDKVISHIEELSKLSTEQLLDGRYAKFRNFGEWQGKE